MEPPAPEPPAAAGILDIVSGPLSAAETALAAHSRAIPSGRDFHFYRSFAPFRSPSDDILTVSRSLLADLAPSSSAPLPPDPEDALHWLVDLDDDFLERVDASLDEFRAERSSLEKGKGGGDGEMESDGFQLVSGKAKRKKNKDEAGEREEKVANRISAKVMVRDKKTGEVSTKVPFHIPEIQRPQEQFEILVNNSNQPFEHVWLERSEDGLRFMHPLEKLSVIDFIDRNVAGDLPIKPLALEETPFTLVEGVKELKELAIKLRDASEFAVDLEHNQYRSFQGLTCLMQISTRNEDFVVDTLKLRIHVGPHLREVFKDPSKRKVMHGADRDILWLQRDFGIYVCNLFDTGQASRVLQLERNSLEYLMHHYCGVTLNKEYQNAEWRLRPIPDEMLKYAREDTHYLLYLYDLMHRDLIAASTDTENGDALIEVYKRSYDVCMQLYEKELLTDTSYLYIYGLRGADFNSEQLAVAAALCEWRDNIARAEDESTGYVLPNRTLLEIARQLPVTANKLRRLVKSKHPLVERSLGSVVSIIREAINNAADFKYVLEQLKKERLEKATELSKDCASKDSESLETCKEASVLANVLGLSAAKRMQSSLDTAGAPVEYASSKISQDSPVEKGRNNCSSAQSIVTRSLTELRSSNSPHETSGGIPEDRPSNLSRASNLTKVTFASVQALKKPTGAFGALLGNSSTKRRPHQDSMRNTEQDVAQKKLEQIKSSVSLPFYSFSGVTVEAAAEIWRPSQCQPSKISDTEEDCEMHHSGVKYEEIIPLGNESDDSRQSGEKPGAVNSPESSREQTENMEGAASTRPEEESPSLSELSCSFQRCFNALNESRSLATSNKKPQASSSSLQMEPFDYAAARRQVHFGQVKEVGDEGVEGQRPGRHEKGRHGRKGPSHGSSGGETGAGFQQPRRRQAFPPTGNRNATFR